MLSVLAVVAAFAATVAAAPITNLPGWSNSTGQAMYSGYEVVDEAHNRQLFYWLVESKQSPETAPLVMWLNGGPGCSSLGGGLLSELGPFYPQADGSLKANEYTWSSVANVIFVESPAGVGFSFSDDPSDYTVGDERSAMDLWKLMQGILEQFPQYQGRDFFISGESYGGHYVPSTAWTVVQQNDAIKAGTVKGHIINIKGFAVGNAWTDAQLDNIGAVVDWWSHALISDSTTEGLLRTCNFSNIGPLMANQAALATGVAVEDILAGGNPIECDYYQTLSGQEQGSQLDIYDIFTDVCTTSNTAAAADQEEQRDARGRLPARNQGEQLMRYLGRESSPAGAGRLAGAPQAALDRQQGRRLAGSDNSAGCEAAYEPCVDNYVTSYLRTPAVQEAIHANTSLPTKWNMCSNIVNYSRADLLSSMLPTYHKVLNAGLRVMVFSGDVDGIVPVTGTRLWLRALNLTEAKDGHWKSWLVNDQIGGYVTKYEEGLSFTTIRNAGHMCPQTQRDRSLHMITKFLNNENL